MAGFFQQFLKGAGDGFFGSPYLRDYKHASKTFVQAQYSNSPKLKWLFHVYFEINKTAVAGDLYEKIFPKDTNLGLLVKSIELPKFSIQLSEMNQYNRKKLVQSKISYDPLRVTFHDDNANQVRHMWHAYFNYYYSDPSQPNYVSTANSKSGVAAPELNRINTYDPDISKNQDWGLKGNITSSDEISIRNKAKFFRSIKIYGFNQHSFALYELINPMIENFNHDTYNYYDTKGIMENTMTIRYETVKYLEGALNGETPNSVVDRFGEKETYDTELSPLNLQGTNRSILGKGGLVDGGLGILEDLSSGDPIRALRAVQTAGRLGKTWKNSSQILQAAKSEVVGGVINSVASGAARGLFNFPAAGATTRTGSQDSLAKNARTIESVPVINKDINPITGRSEPKP
jgi:hypothetical protein